MHHDARRALGEMLIGISEFVLASIEKRDGRLVVAIGQPLPDRDQLPLEFVRGRRFHAAFQAGDDVSTTEERRDQYNTFEQARIAPRRHQYTETAKRDAHGGYAFSDQVSPDYFVLHPPANIAIPEIAEMRVHRDERGAGTEALPGSYPTALE